MRRKYLLGALFVLLISFTANSQILMDENFDYPAGDSLGAHGWVSFSGGSTNILSVATPGLTFSGYPLTNIGNSARVRNNGQDAYKQFDSVMSGSVYTAFMVRVDSGKSGDYFLAYLPNSNTQNYAARVYVKDSSGSVSFGLSKSSASNGPIVYTGNSYTYGTTYLLIVKYTFLSGTNDDEMRLYVFSGTIPATEPAPTIGPVIGTSATNTDSPNISRITLRQGSSGSSPTLNIDGIRVFKSWSNIVGITPISSVAEKFTLSQNYPNPFNPVTNIRFSIPERGTVSLKVFDMLGKEVSNLVDGNFAIGTYEVNFDAKGFGSGTYIYRMSFNSETGKNFIDTKKMILVK